MKTVKSMLWALALLPLPLLAGEQCQGNWRLHFETASATVLTTSEQVLLQGSVNVDKSARDCLRAMNLSAEDRRPLSLTSRGHRLPADLLDDQYRQLPIAGNGGYRLPLDPSGLTLFWLRLPTAGQAEAGDYRQIIRATASVDNRVQKQQVHYRVPPRVEVTVLPKPWISGSHRQYLVELGELTHGVTKEIDFKVRSNSMVLMRVHSDNRGKLVHDTLSQQYFAYRISINKMPYPLQSAYWRPLLSNDVRLQISTQPKSHPRAGKYQDKLSITFKAI
ncbi:hypothetical protein [Ferrimonas senticii]|uniref:hypothetical protein n=1 Tax=Ferrimonas senticii TaxID=394566 RepID=UPI0004010DDF|nr:hypothetical protein [Ferrimonas senticii]